MTTPDEVQQVTRRVPSRKRKFSLLRVTVAIIVIVFPVAVWVLVVPGWLADRWVRRAEAANLSSPAEARRWLEDNGFRIWLHNKDRDDGWIWYGTITYQSGESFDIAQVRGIRGELDYSIDVVFGADGRLREVSRWKRPRMVWIEDKLAPLTRK